MRILIVDDDQHTSNLLSAILAAHHYAVDAIADGAVGLELAGRWSYDLILLDVMIPSLNGFEVCRRLRNQGCQTPILILTTKGSNEDIVTGLDAGADDYVAKPCDSSQLLARVRALLRRSGSASVSPVLTWELLCLNPATAQVTYNQKIVPLRPKEYNLLELFLRHPQRILSRTNIIDHLWSIDEPPVEGSVTNLIKDLRRRLKSAGMEADLIETVYGLGYRLNPVPTGGRGREKQEDTTVIAKAVSRTQEEIASEPVLVTVWDDDGHVREQRGITTIRQVTEQFQKSLEKRIGILEGVGRSLQTSNLSFSEWETACKEAHNLAGGLGTFGYVQASQIAQAIEHLLIANPESPCAFQFAQLLEELRQELAKPHTNQRIAASNIGVSNISRM